jgi:hypothetical protein
MEFNELSKKYLSGSTEDRQASSIEYMVKSGSPLAAGLGSNDIVFTLLGNGKATFYRRGDFMERGDVPPGKWEGECPPEELSTIWKLLGDLNEDSFPARVADPGDPLSYLTAFFPNQLEVQYWGPRNHALEARGDDFLVALAKPMNIAAEGKCIWSVEMKVKGNQYLKGELHLEIELKNSGSDLIHLPASSRRNSGNFIVRYAYDKDVPPDVTPLPLNWEYAPMTVEWGESVSFYPLTPGSPLNLKLRAKINIESGK